MTTIEIIILTMLIFLIVPCVLKENRGYKNRLSLQTTNSLKGIMCLLIVFFHIPDSIGGGYLLNILNDTGYLIVGVFFFLSGYGLMTGFCDKRNYLDGFLKRRILPLCFPWLIASILYTVMFFCLGGYNLFMEKVYNVENGFLIISHSWYIVVQIILYICFYFSGRIIKVKSSKRNVLIVITAMLYVTIMIVIMNRLKMGAWWYYSLLAFAVGILLKVYEANTKRNKKTDILIILVSLSFFILSYIARYYNSKIFESYFIWIISKLTASASIAVFLGSLCYFIRFVSSFASFLARNSYNIYLIHMLFYILLRSEILYISSDIIYLLLTIVLSILYSQLYEMVIGQNMKKEHVRFFGR